METTPEIIETLDVLIESTNVFVAGIDIESEDIGIDEEGFIYVDEDRYIERVSCETTPLHSKVSDLLLLGNIATLRHQRPHSQRVNGSIGRTLLSLEQPISAVMALKKSDDMQSLEIAGQQCLEEGDIFDALNAFLITRNDN